MIHHAIQRLKKIGSTVLQSRVARFLVHAEHKLMIVAHKTRDIAEAAVKRFKPPPTHEQTERLKRVLFIADFVGGYATGAAGGAIAGVIGAKVGMLLPSASALYVTYATVRDPAAVWAAAREVVGQTFKKASVKAFLPEEEQGAPRMSQDQIDQIIAEINTDWKEAVFLAAIAEEASIDRAIEIAIGAGEMPEITPLPTAADFGMEDEEEAQKTEQKALASRMKKRQWISTKVAIIMKDGIRGRAVSQAQAVAVAHKLWAKKKNRRRHPSQAKAVEVVWLATGGISVDAERLQFKKTDGAEDGLNEERRDEHMDQEFNPLEVPPIAVWQAPHSDDTREKRQGQIYVVDGHKRLDHAKRKGVPAIRAFFIDAETFEEAKKKGERLNEKMGTKAFDALETAIILKAFDESKHPRGQPGNAGQFAKGSGSGYSHVEIIRNVRKEHATELTAPSHDSGADKDTKRPKTTEKGAYVSRAEYMILRTRAMNKIRHIANDPAHKPTAQEKKDNLAKIKEKGANKARKDLNGNNIQRRERKVALAKEFGDGKTCGCAYCGMVISFSKKFSKKSMEEDKIHETAAGGKYKMPNLLPACVSCNRSRGDRDAMKFLQESTYGQEGKK